jgi:hypothetical protein
MEVRQCPDVVSVESPNTNWTNERSTAMEKHCTSTPEKIIQFNESAIYGHLSEMVRHSVEATLNQMLDAEADQLCHADKYQRLPHLHRQTRRSKQQDQGHQTQGIWLPRSAILYAKDLLDLLWNLLSRRRTKFVKSVAISGISSRKELPRENEDGCITTERAKTSTFGRNSKLWREEY